MSQHGGQLGHAPGMQRLQGLRRTPVERAAPGRDEGGLGHVLGECVLEHVDGLVGVEPLVQVLEPAQSRLQSTPLPERVAGSDLISSLSAAAAQHDRSIALLGGMPGAVEGAAHVLRVRHPELRLAGVLDAPEGQDRAALVESLRTMRPDIVYLSLGKIAEERLIDHLRARLPGVWFMGVGSGFAFLAGHLRRAPRWMREAGLEWLHRWAQEPARLTPRHCRCIPFSIRLLGEAAVYGSRRRIGGQ
jgi:exopolysaccharide biosynthesis WecB/TagA/CpsF family protein